MSRHFITASSQYLELASLMVPTFPFTFFAWVNPRAIGASMSVISFANNLATTSYHSVEIAAAGNLRCRTNGTAASSDATGVEVMAIGRWYPLGGEWTGTAARAAYMRGVRTTNGTSRTDVAALTRTSVGRKGNSGTFQYFHGLIAHPTIWNVALTPGEHIALAHGVHPLRIRPEAIQFYGRMNINGPEIDASNARYTLTPSGSPLLGEDPPMVERETISIFDRGLWGSPAAAGAPTQQQLMMMGMGS